MSIFHRKGFFLVVLMLVLPVTYAAKQSVVFHRSFWEPNYHGERLNYCTLDGKCGMTVASRYCQIMGYQRADQLLISHNIGLSNYLGVHARCVGWRCNGFKTIRCRSEITHKPPKSYHYRLRRFVYPRYNHYRVDWCYDGARNCGKRVAYSFCRRLGYRSARHFIIQKHVAATQAIGNQKLCFGPQCNAFKQIDCFR